MLERISASGHPLKHGRVAGVAAPPPATDSWNRGCLHRFLTFDVNRFIVAILRGLDFGPMNGSPQRWHSRPNSTHKMIEFISGILFSLFLDWYELGRSINADR